VNRRRANPCTPPCWRHCATAKIGADRIHGICIGAAGPGGRRIAGKIQNILAELTAASIEVVGDMVIALEAAFGEGPA